MPLLLPHSVNRLPPRGIALPMIPPSGGVGCAASAGPAVRAVLGGVLLVLLATMAPGEAGLVLTSEARAGQVHATFLESRRTSLRMRDNPFKAPSQAQIVVEEPAPWTVRKYTWHHQVNATVFWVGELPSARNPTPNTASSWDPRWVESYGGLDHPHRRRGYHPEGFTPRLNPFYIALPYNDLNPDGSHRPEAPDAIPWFWDSYRGNSVSVCEDRWVAIHHRGQVCFAQWKDVGPFRTDDWEYVFQGRRPQPNPNNNAGIDLSPAVRDFLGIRGSAKVDWRFVEVNEVRDGPWAEWVLDTPPGSP